MQHASLDPSKVVLNHSIVPLARRSVLLGLCAAPTAASTAARAAAPSPPELARLAQLGPFAAAIDREPLTIEPPPPGLPAGLAPAARLRTPAAGAAHDARACLPLVVFIAGFLCSSSQYSGLLDHLCSWGFPVASYDYDTRQFLPDPQAAALASSVAASGLCALARRGRRCGGQGGGDGGDGGGGGAVYYVGHSRGAKLSVLAAAAQPAPVRVAALGLIDPVDQTFDSESAPGSVTSLPALQQLSRQGVPVAIAAAGRNGDCVPRRAGAAAFARACGVAGGAGGSGSTGGSSSGGGGGGGGGPCVLAVAREAGHLQFLESPTTLQRSVCFYSSKLDESALRAWTAALLTAHGLAAAGALEAAAAGAGGSGAGAGGGGGGGPGPEGAGGSRYDAAGVAAAGTGAAARLGLSVSVTT